MTNVESLRREPVWMVGPFETYAVVLGGRLIPRLAARVDGADVVLSLDNRLALTVPADMAYQVADFVANALAIGAGYSGHDAETADKPFAPRCIKLDG